MAFWTKNNKVEENPYITPMHVVAKAFSELDDDFIKYDLIEEKVKELWPKARQYSNGHFDLSSEEVLETTVKQFSKEKHKKRPLSMVMKTANEENMLNGFPLKGSYCIVDNKLYEKLISEYNSITN